MKNFYFALVALFVLVVFSCVLFQEENSSRFSNLDIHQDAAEFSQSEYPDLSFSNIVMTDTRVEPGDDIEVSIDCQLGFGIYDNTFDYDLLLMSNDSISWYLDSVTSELGFDDAVDGFESMTVVIP